MDMWNKLNLDAVINEALAVRNAKGYVDSEHIQALTLMQLAGGEALEHLLNFKENVGAPLQFEKLQFAVGLFHKLSLLKALPIVTVKGSVNSRTDVFWTVKTKIYIYEALRG